MKMGQGVRTGLGHGGITCVLQTQFSSYYLHWRNTDNRVQKNVIYIFCSLGEIWVINLKKENEVHV